MASWTIGHSTAPPTARLVAAQRRGGASYNSPARHCSPSRHHARCHAPLLASSWCPPKRRRGRPLQPPAGNPRPRRWCPQKPTRGRPQLPLVSTPGRQRGAARYNAPAGHHPPDGYPLPCARIALLAALCVPVLASKSQPALALCSAGVPFDDKRRQELAHPAGRHLDRASASSSAPTRFRRKSRCARRGPTILELRSGLARQ